MISDWTKQQLRELRFTPQKDFGQSFLVDPAALDALLQFGAPKRTERIIEIGGGLGALTGELLEASKLTVIEIEPKLATVLRNRFPDVEVIEADVRDVEFESFGHDLTIFGNLPYSFSSEILFLLLHHRRIVRRAVLLLQREFVARLGAHPGTKQYGSLTVLTQLAGEVFLGPIIGGQSFVPPVQVDSQVIEIRFFAEDRFPVTSDFFLQQVLRAAFFKRRQKIANSMKASQIISPGKVQELFQLAELDPDRRAETFSVEEYVALGNIYAEIEEMK